LPSASEFIGTTWASSAATCSDLGNGDGRFREKVVANENFNDPERTPVPTWCLPSSIQSLPLAPSSEAEDVEFLERLYKLEDPRKEKTD
jgi:hypothetical protein